LGPYIPSSPVKDFAAGGIVGEARPSVVANSTAGGGSNQKHSACAVKDRDREAEEAARTAGKSILEALKPLTSEKARFPFQELQWR